MMFEQRKNYRKNLTLTGYLTHDGEARKFRTRNLSLRGLLAHFDDYQGVYKDIPVRVHLPVLHLVRYMYPIWQKPTEDGGFDMGFEFCLRLKVVEGNPHRAQARVTGRRMKSRFLEKGWALMLVPCSALLAHPAANNDDR